jgi:hypothetical protein
MKSRAILAIICVAGVMADPAQARLGETSEECKARYGVATVGRIELGEELQQSGKDWEAAVYSAHGLKIQVVFAEGKAVFIEYSNEPIFSLGSGHSPTVDLSISEIAYLKAANAGAKRKWSIHTEGLCKKVAPSLTVWRSSDQEFHAGYNRERKELFICTRSFWDLVIGVVRERYDPAKEKEGGTRFDGL